MFKKQNARTKMDEKHKINTDNIAEEAVDTNETTENSTEKPVTDNVAEDQAEQEQSDALAEMQKQYDEMKDKYLRLSAEFDNYRKRTLKEKMDLTKSAGEDILKGLLPVMDDFERGLKSMDQASDVQAVKEGISLIYNKFREFLSQKGVKEIEAVDKDFDTDLHEAITKIAIPDKSGKVVDVVEKGYVLNEKVIRYAKVVVGE